MDRQDLIIVSERIRQDTRDALRYIHELGVANGALVLRNAVSPPEETTTFNSVLALARRVASRGSTGTARVLLHSKYLEGTGVGGTNPSKGDLQLAIELSPGGRWLNLAVQAKRFYPNDGTYKEWKSADNKRLSSWAARYRAIPAMLLYNTMTHPFPQVHRAPTTLFQGCGCQPGHLLAAATYRFWQVNKPPAQAYSPLALSMVLDHNSMVTLDSPTPADLETVAFPWECLLCPKNLQIHGGGPTGGGPTDSGPTGSGLSDEIPDWADVVERVTSPQAENGENILANSRLEDIVTDSNTEDFDPIAWVVLRADAASDRRANPKR